MLNFLLDLRGATIESSSTIQSSTLTWRAFSKACIMKHLKWFVFAACMICGLTSYGKDKIDFSELSSPIIFRGDHKHAYRDPAVIFHNGSFYLYFTLSETAADGGYYNMTAYSISPDLVHWTFPKIVTPRDRSLISFATKANGLSVSRRIRRPTGKYSAQTTAEFGSCAARTWRIGLSQSYSRSRATMCPGKRWAV